MNNALILIIEDEPEIAEIIGTYLSREGFRVVTAGDGTVGLAHHQRLRPDLVVLDIKLPGQDGYEVLAAIMSLNRSTRLRLWRVLRRSCGEPLPVMTGKCCASDH